MQKIAPGYQWLSRHTTVKGNPTQSEGHRTEILVGHVVLQGLRL